MYHFIKKCSCGNVIAQCKCMSCDKHIETVLEGCQECIARKQNKADITKPTYEYLWEYLNYQYPATKGDILLKKLCDELHGLNNKYKYAVDMAAIAENKVEELKEALDCSDRCSELQNRSALKEINSLKRDLACEERCAEQYERSAIQEKNNLKQKLDEMTQYADKLAVGLPCLPKDIENLREANLHFATENDNLQKKYELLKSDYKNLKESYIHHINSK